MSRSTAAITYTSMVAHLLQNSVEKKELFLKKYLSFLQNIIRRKICFYTEKKFYIEKYKNVYYRQK